MRHPEQRFDAVLEKGDRALGWTIVRLPFQPGDVWNTMVRQRVQGTINGIAFRTSFFLDAPGSYYLLINRATQHAAGVVAGSRASLTLAPDLDERPADLPDELGVLLADGLQAFYESLSEYTRREIGKWVAAVKSDKARMRRAEQMAERLLATMDAERELPPLIESALRKNAKASAGWGLMTDTQRRNELMAVFYYQGVEARAKRVEGLVRSAAKKAG